MDLNFIPHPLVETPFGTALDLCIVLSNRRAGHLLRDPGVLVGRPPLVRLPAHLLPDHGERAGVLFDPGQLDGPSAPPSMSWSWSGRWRSLQPGST